MIFRDAGSRDVYLAIARFANLSIGFDPTFRDTPVTVDLRNSTLDGALRSVSEATQTFWRVTGPRSVLIIPDTPAKRREFEEEVVRTFYLSNADLKETMDLLRMVLDARRVSPVTATNAVTVKDTPERIAAAARVISAIDKARPEVIIDVELLEVDRTKLQEYGLQIASSGSAGINGSAGIATDANSTLTLRTLRNLTQSDVLLANLPSLYYRLLKTDTNTRTLANPQLRTSEGMPAQARFGERIPVPVTTFAPIATGGTAQQPITSFNYENIGVNIDITPRTHHDDDVTAGAEGGRAEHLAGTGFGGLPTFGNREISTVIRLRDGETNMLAGLIRDDERRVLEGVPGLSDLPVIGHDLRALEDGVEADRHHPDADATHRARPRSGRERPGRVSRSAVTTGSPPVQLPALIEPAQQRVHRRSHASADAAGRARRFSVRICLARAPWRRTAQTTPGDSAQPRH